MGAPAVFLDRDGTLVHVRHYPSRPEELVLYDGVAAELRRLREAGFRLVVITNQSGLARGLFTVDDLVRMHDHLSAELDRFGARPDAVYFCPHHPDGSVADLASWHGDLMLGVDSGAVRQESVVTLDRGSTVLLYTDGLVERRDADLDTGVHLLRECLTELSELPLEQLLDEVLERLVDGRPEDDVALVAVRLHPQDGPRPVEAGPNRVPDVVPDDPAS